MEFANVGSIVQLGLSAGYGGVSCSRTASGSATSRASPGDQHDWAVRFHLVLYTADVLVPLPTQVMTTNWVAAAAAAAATTTTDDRKKQLQLQQPLDPVLEQLVTAELEPCSIYKRLWMPTATPDV